MKGRKNAMLTTEDRRWLVGEKTYEGEHAKQQRYQRRRDIRERVYNSILDFSILFDHMKSAERDKLFSEALDQQTGTVEFVNGLRDAMAFILQNTDITKAMTRNADNKKNPLGERLLRDALFHAGKKDDILLENVTIEFDATHMPIESILENLHAGKTISPEGIRILLESERVDTEVIQNQIRDMIFDAK